MNVYLCNVCKACLKDIKCDTNNNKLCNAIYVSSLFLTHNVFLIIYTLSGVMCRELTMRICVSSLAWNRNELLLNFIAILSLLLIWNCDSWDSVFVVLVFLSCSFNNFFFDFHGYIICMVLPDWYSSLEYYVIFFILCPSISLWCLN